MSFMDDFLAKNQVLLQIIGSIMLFFFGIYTFRSNPVQSIRPVSSTPGSYLHNFVTAFFVTLSNPLIIFLFIGLFARFSFVMPGSPIGFQLVGYLAIVLGALLWWFGITYFVNKVRTRFNLRGIWIFEPCYRCYSDVDVCSRLHLYYIRKNDVLTGKHILCEAR